MKKVLLVSGSLPPIRCGVGYYTYRLSRELAEADIDFELLSTEGVDKDTPAPLLTVPDWRIRSLPKILDRIKQSGAGIIHIQYPAVGYRRQLGINLLPYALRVLRPRMDIIITLHEYSQSRWVGRCRNFITVWPAHKILVSNRPDLDALKRFSRKTSVIPIGANFETAPKRPEFFNKTMRAQKLDPKKPTLVFFGYAFPNKKLEALLDALDEPQLLNYQALLLASLDDKTAYQRMLSEKVARLNRTGNRVGMTGFLEGEDVSAIMQECRYFVLPNTQPISAKSGTAIAAIQNAMTLISHGSLDRPELTAPFEHLKNSYLLDDTTPQAIAGAIDRLDNSPGELKKILQGAEQLKKYFSWGDIVKKHIKLYGQF